MPHPRSRPSSAGRAGYPTAGVRAILLLLAAAALFGCAREPKPKAPFALTAVRFADLPGWQADGVAAALPALRRSCEKLMQGSPADSVGTPAAPLSRGDWMAPCTAAARVPLGDDDAARAFFEAWFAPYSAAGPDGAEGLFTGYFEAELQGSRAPGGRYTVPIYRLPGDLVTVDLGKFDPGLKGRTVVGRVENGRLLPYYARRAIDAGALAGRGLELLWLDHPIDAFLLHVQGSGRVDLPDGSAVRVGFAGHNGRPYVSIGRALIERGELSADQASWPDIRAWIDANPDKAADLLAVNPRYIFFRVVDSDAGDDGGPIGAQGVPLTPGRSLAVDRRFVPLGMPIWLDTTWPGERDRPLRRLMVAQDTGSAIKGPVRGDFFWGFGAAALREAGRMKSRGRYYLLLPKAAAQRVAGN